MTIFIYINLYLIIFYNFGRLMIVYEKNNIG